MNNPNQPQGMNPEDFIDFEKAELQRRNMELANALTGSSATQDDQNLIHYQLETDKILERVEHFLKGDEIKIGEEGAYYTEPTKKVIALVKEDPISKINYYIQEIRESKKGSELLKEVLVKIVNKEGDELNVLEEDSKLLLRRIKNVRLKTIGYKYVSIIDESKKPLNEYGVAELMRIMSMYITKETFLSRYSEERINEILGDLGDALNNFFYCNYEKMGMDTKYKESKYSLIILNLLHVVENCYRRAIGGFEQENLKTRAIVTQSGGFNVPPNQQRVMQMKKRWNPFKPSTW